MDLLVLDNQVLKSAPDSVEDCPYQIDKDMLQPYWGAIQKHSIDQTDEKGTSVRHYNIVLKALF